MNTSMINTLQSMPAGFTNSLESIPFAGKIQASANPFATADPASAPSFKNVMVNLLNQASEVEGLPGQLMTRAMTTGDVDVHDIMIANAKADLFLNVAVQSTTKVLQAYDRILQIQV